MIDLDELMRLREAATPGPWKTMCHTTCYGDCVEAVGDVDGDMIVNTAETALDEHANAAYIVAACNAVPELVARIRELEDAAGFEARVAKKLSDPFWNYAVAERYFELALPYRRLPAAVLLKAARLEVEADMIRESNNNSTPPEWLMRRFTEVK